MNTQLYVGNLSAGVTEDALRKLFSDHGPVTEVRCLTDGTGRFRGSAYVTMASPEAATTAREALHTCGFEGRYITVHEARPEGTYPPGSRIGDVDPLRSKRR